MKRKQITAKIVGENIRYYRKQKGWTQAQLGILAFGYTSNEENAAHSRISKFENGRQEPRATELARLASTLQVDCSHFFDLSIKLLVPKAKKVPFLPAVKSADPS